MREFVGQSRRRDERPAFVSAVMVADDCVGELAGEFPFSGSEGARVTVMQTEHLGFRPVSVAPQTPLSNRKDPAARLATQCTITSLPTSCKSATVGVVHGTRVGVRARSPSAATVA